VHWIPIAAWAFAGVLALIVLGFCGYEVSWKAQRLQRDLRRLQGLTGQLTELRGQLAEAQERVAAAGLR
jgi:hypothetical protein